MTRILFVLAALAVSSSAFAETLPSGNTNGPIRNGNHCWATTDSRGFGYWDTCSKQTTLELKSKGLTTRIDTATTQGEVGEGGGSSGGGGGGGGGGGR